MCWFALIVRPGSDPMADDRQPTPGIARTVDHVDLATGLAVALAGAAIIVLLPSQIGGETIAALSNMNSPAFFAALSGVGLLLFGSVLAARSVFRSAVRIDFVIERPFRVAAAAGVLVAGVASTFVFGLLPVSAAIVLALGLVFDYRRYWLLALIAAACPVLVYVLFERMLLVLLPRGWF